MKAKWLGGIWIGLCLLVPGANAAQAQKLQSLIDNVVAAYGGDALLNMDTLVLRDESKGFRYGQSYNPVDVDALHCDALIAIDFKQQRIALQWLRGKKPDYSLQHQVFDGKTGFSIDHSGRTIRENPNLHFGNTDRRVSYYLDTVLVKALLSVRQQAKYAGEIDLRGKPHSQIVFQAKDYPQMTLFVDNATGMITQMKQDSWVEGEYLLYQYANHHKINGVRFAQETYLTEGGSPENLTLSRDIEVNQNVDTYFALPQGYGQQGESLVFAQLESRKIDDNLYIAGQDWGFSIFYDAGDYFIAAGGYDGLTDRLAAIQKLSGKNNPLKYLVVSHHHRDHLAGMNEAAMLGANFITVKAHVDAVKANIKEPITDERFIIVDGQQSFEQGKVKVFDFPNYHSSHNLITWVPSAKLVFTVDMYLSREATGSPEGDVSLLQLQALFEQNNMQPRRFAAAHSGRILTEEDFAWSLKNHYQAVCPAFLHICQ